MRVDMRGLPLKPTGEWVHMSDVEADKLEWMRDLPAPSSADTKVGLSSVSTVMCLAASMHASSVLNEKSGFQSLCPVVSDWPARQVWPSG